MIKAKWTVMVLAVALAACSAPKLEKRAPGAGPDEFSIVPNKALVAPDSYSALPEPTPFGANLADATPKADLAKALGGRTTDGVDGGIVNYASRYGVDANIRAELAKSDESFRKLQRGYFFAGWFGGDRYQKAYRRHALDPFAEALRLQAAGITTPNGPSK